MRVIGLIAAYNERRFIEPCLAHLERHGVEAYLIDNCSTDNTVALAERWLDRNLIGIESFPRADGDVYDWRGLLRRKEELAASLDADWFIHSDPDEFRLPPSQDRTLAEALRDVDRAGFNAVDFAEFTFVPTQEQPDHDHAEFQQTMRRYYAFAPPVDLHQLKAWKAQPEVELQGGGHRASFPGINACPHKFIMKHYLILSVPHAIEKYVERNYDPDEVKKGWHGWRASVEPADIRLPPESDLLLTESDDDLDPSMPRETHLLNRRPPVENT